MLKINKKIILVFLVFILIFSIMQFIVPQIIGFDGYIHIKAADIIKKEGVIKNFKWTKESILSQNFADTHLLFRIILIPFTFFGLNSGAKIASILFGATCLTVFYWFLCENKIRYAFFWTILYLFSTESLMYRFLLPRQMTIFVTILILTIYFLKKRNYWFIGIISFISVLLYSGFAIQIFLVLLYLIIEKIFSGKFSFKILIFSLGGLLAGLIINPYFPLNISMLYTQIFQVNLFSNLYNAEWRAWPFIEFIKNNLLILFYLIASLYILIKDKRLNKDKSYYWIVSLFFLVFTFKSRRMQEYLVPFSIILFSLFFNNYSRRLSKNLRIASVVILVIIAGFNSTLLRKDVINNNFLHNFRDCTEWMEENVEKGSLVFNNAYSFPYLFFRNSGLEYTHGVDLTYSFLYDANKFGRYMKILKGEQTQDNGKDWIAEDYKPDYVFIGKIKQDVELYKYIIKNKENYKIAYEDEWCAVLRTKGPIQKV